MNQNQQDIDENLLLQYLLGNADKELVASIEVWLSADNRNRHCLDQLESLWLETGKLTPAPVAVDVEAAWEKVSMRISLENLKLPVYEKEKPTRIKLYRSLLGAAAMIILLIGVYTIFRLIHRPVKQVELFSGITIVHDTLPDGSKVSLNKNSRLVFPEKFSKSNREVTLTGEALFEVEPNKAYPFIVNTSLVGIRVLGTIFSVNTHSDGVVLVSVTQGIVMLFKVDERNGDTLSLLLHTGECGMMKKGALHPVRTEATSPDGLFWANHTLDFRSTLLSEVFTMLEKYYSVKITASDPSVMNCRLTATFLNEPVNRILAIIAESFNLELQTQGKIYHFTGQGCNNESK